MLRCINKLKITKKNEGSKKGNNGLKDIDVI